MNILRSTTYFQQYIIFGTRTEPRHYPEVFQSYVHFFTFFFVSNIYIEEFSFSLKWKMCFSVKLQSIIKGKNRLKNLIIRRKQIWRTEVKILSYCLILQGTRSVFIWSNNEQYQETSLFTVLPPASQVKAQNNLFLWIKYYELRNCIL